MGRAVELLAFSYDFIGTLTVQLRRVYCVFKVRAPPTNSALTLPSH